MIFQSMAANAADGISVIETSPDLEVFRLRLGKALDYEFLEKELLFQRREPRQGGTLFC